MRTRMSEAMSKAVSISMTKSMLKSTRGQFSPFLPVSKEADIFETSQFKIFEMLAKSKFGLSTNSYQPQISAIVKEELRKSTEYFAVGEYRYCTSDMNENETVICRENDRHPGPREELLRIGQLATGLHAPFLTTIGINPSRSGRYMGCLFETSIGSTTQMFVVTDIANKVNYEISIRDSTKKQHINKIHSFEWGRELVDCSGNVVGVEAFFVMQNSGRPNRVYKCSFNTPTVDQPLKHTNTTGTGDTYNPILKRVEIAAADMTLIYSERDPAFFIDIRLSRDGSALICTSQAKLCSEVHVLPLSPDVSDSTPVLKKVVSRQSNMKCFIDCTGDFVFAVTNGTLLQEEKQQQRQPSSDRSLSMYCIDKSWLHAATTIQTVADWKRVWPMSTDSTFALEDYEIFQSAVVLFGSDKGKSQIVVCSRDQLSGVWKVISQPSPASDPIVKSAIQKALFTNSDLSEMPSLLQFKPVSAQTYNSKFARFDVECPLLRPGEGDAVSVA